MPKKLLFCTYAVLHTNKVAQNRYARMEVDRAWLYYIILHTNHVEQNRKDICKTENAM